LLSPESEINLYRIVQEATNNVVRHSGAKHAHVAIKRHGQSVHVTIRDDGLGFEPDVEGANEGRRGGMGLTGMSERARILGGKCVIRSASGKGTEVVVRFGLDGGRVEVSDDGYGRS
jgi:signal transduction histidine kinase